jgi:hypothetical protein
MVSVTTEVRAMNNTVPAFFGLLVFALIISVWNWITGTLPGTVGGGLNWIMLLVAAIVGVGAFLTTANR